VSGPLHIGAEQLAVPVLGHQQMPKPGLVDRRRSLGCALADTRVPLTPPESTASTSNALLPSFGTAVTAAAAGASSHEPPAIGRVIALRKLREHLQVTPADHLRPAQLGRGPKGFGVGRELRSGLGRSRRGSPIWSGGRPLAREHGPLMTGRPRTAIGTLR
jgi:hypothetical protein